MVSVILDVFFRLLPLYQTFVDNWKRSHGGTAPTEADVRSAFLAEGTAILDEGYQWEQQHKALADADIIPGPI
jgi:hypothetical protein